MGAALLGHSLARLEAVPMGYDLDHVLTFQVRLPEAAYPDSASQTAYLQNVEKSLAGIPGVRAAGATTLIPQQKVVFIGLRVAPQGAPEGDAAVVGWVRVSAGYFAAMGIPVAEGTPFSQGSAGRWDWVVVNESLARRLFPDGPLTDRGVTLDVGERSVPSRIEAVVGDVQIGSQRTGPSNILYTSIVRSPSPYIAFAVRATGSPTLLTDRVRQVAASVDPSVPPFNVTTTGEAAANRISTERAVAVLSRMFSLAALVLAALGLYGLVSQELERRRRELGIRLVLGARPAGLVRQAMLGALTLASVGLVLGLVAAAATVGYLSTLLFEVPAEDPVAFTAVVVAVLIVTAVASWLPARRVTAVDPIDALRAE
jgi:putative ABC transport system permease protein